MARTRIVTQKIKRQSLVTWFPWGAKLHHRHRFCDLPSALSGSILPDIAGCWSALCWIPKASPGMSSGCLKTHRYQLSPHSDAFRQNRVHLARLCQMYSQLWTTVLLNTTNVLGNYFWVPKTPCITTFTPIRRL